MFFNRKEERLFGVSTWVKKKYHLKSCKTALGMVEFDNEGRYLINEIEDLLVYNIYFPSGTSGELRQAFKYNFLDHLFDHIQSLSPNDKQRLVLAGDFNICHQDIDIHHPIEATKRGLTGFLPQERRWMDKLVSAGLIDTLREVKGNLPKQYSWWSFRANSRAKNLGWRIDYIFTDLALKHRIKDAMLLPQVSGSDHCPMLTVLD